MTYPNNTYPSDPDFPAATSAAKLDVSWYSVTTSYISDITSALAAISDNAGNISLGAAKVIKWGGSAKISYASGAVQVAKLTILDDWSYDTLAVSGDANISGAVTANTGTAVTLSGNLTVIGVLEATKVAADTLTLVEVAEPDDPDDEHAVMWLSNGTGIGDAGDLMIKIQHNGVVKSKTIIDFA